MNIKTYSSMFTLNSLSKNKMTIYSSSGTNFLQVFLLAKNGKEAELPQVVKRHNKNNNLFDDQTQTILGDQIWSLTSVTLYLCVNL